MPQFVKVMPDSELQTLATELLVPGDVILLEEDGNVPADCRLIEGAGVRVNTSTITGESLPKARTTGAESNITNVVLDARNLLLAAYPADC